MDEFASKHDRGQEVGLTTAWAVPWSDLMMVMFVLFVVLFTYQAAERDLQDAFQVQTKLPAERPSNSPLDDPSFVPLPSREIFEQTREVVRETDLDDIDVVLQDDESVKLSVRGPLFFDLGKTALRPETRKFLDRIAVVLQRTDRRIQVIGHTDTFPISSERFPTNWELSAVRATTVARYLIERGSLEAGRFSVIGHSMYRPDVPNSSLQNKARNRRVEIVITKEVHRASEWIVS